MFKMIIVNKTTKLKRLDLMSKAKLNVNLT